MQIEDLQNDIPETVNFAKSIVSDLECAESCDSAADFCDNLQNAIDTLAIMKRELSALLKQAKKSAECEA